MAESVTLADGTVVTVAGGEVQLQPPPGFVGDGQALALAASQDAAVQALLAQAAQAGPGGFSYSGSPNSSPLDRVRFSLGDTNAKTAQFTDGEILALLEDAGEDPLAAALLACDALVAKYAGACDESVGSVSMAYSQKAAGYRALADTLRARLAKRAVPYAGGISYADKRRQQMDRDRVQPQFSVEDFNKRLWRGELRYRGSAGYFLELPGWNLYPPV